MSANKEIFLRMRESDFNEYENNRNDPNYIKLYKEQKKAKDNLQKYLHQKRHK